MSSSGNFYIIAHRTCRLYVHRSHASHARERRDAQFVPISPQTPREVIPLKMEPVVRLDQHLSG